ncbi:GTPase Era: mitochondrial-like protein [Dinothrombium tinctorium]|uniref:GTPase Era, mitochondrial n=1 Tax=Dinothrombium tinctorium TaxID=1965070 RepID=A0A3S3QSU3_9ACAR|nr:GTPase Era: mitochondrial-like protein [Dinothrombium tinctorium]RWS13470.1 GTPase Era: mitochondrial-like protein [Dinothrombium tinctorium]RWS13985.1 GTPase Era: mitochondrial-like protein [Dinothrombium tinctorium]RWS13993.1 GTPase Era: mitochondrial-like protein [Dinothrombium tinctorium]
MVPKTRDEYQKMKQMPVNEPVNAMLNRVAIIGMPNAGKSTLTNQLIGWKVSPVSSKVHTTRQNVVGVFIEGSTQVEILDTPGLVTPQHCVKFNLEPTFIGDSSKSASTADLIAVICDVSNRREREKLNRGILNLLYKHHDKPSILILNKVDLIVAKRKLVGVIDTLTDDNLGKDFKSSIKRQYPIDERNYKSLFTKTEKLLKKGGEVELKSPEKIEKPNEDKKGWPYFSKVFLISALEGDGIDELRKYLVETAKPNPWKYNEMVVTDQKPDKLAIGIIKEKFLDVYHDEIPYTVELKIDNWDIDQMGTLWIVVNVNCPKERYIKMVIGPEGKYISKVANLARMELSNTFHADVSLKLIVRCIEKRKK